MMVANLLAAPLLVALMWGVVAHHVLLTWLAVLVIACTLTLILYLYLKPFFKELTTVPTKWFYYQLPLLFGLIWGSTGYLFFTPESMAHIAFLIIFLFGMTAGGVSGLSSLWFSFAALAIPTLFPFVLMLLFEGHRNSLFLGATTLIFLLVMLALSRLTNQNITTSLKLRYENFDLLKDLEDQKNEALKASKDKSRFLSSASHDLRQPVHSLSLLTSAIEPEITSQKGIEILSQISKTNKVMLDLLNSLLDISKLDAELIKPNLELVDLQKTIRNLIGEFEMIAKQNGLQLLSHSPAYFVKTDPVLLDSILRNLLQNAIRYTKEGKILIACRKRSDSVLIQIWDTGKGIAPEYQELIFNEFQQLQNPERDHNKGLGLGLAICRRLSNLIGATLSLKSQLARGTVFTLELPPVSAQEVIDTQLQNEKKPLKVKTINFNHVTILVVDDNEAVLNAMTALLESWGCKVLTADSIETTKVVAENNQNNIDAVIVDYRLRKNTTGVEAINAIQHIVRTPIAKIIITGDTAPNRMKEIVSHGIPVLHKPVNSIQLKIALGSMLRNKT